MLRNALIFLSENALARRISMRAPGARTIARRFVAGETIADGMAAARALAEGGFFVTLDYLGESVQSREEARVAADTYIELIDRIAADPLLKARVNVSLKLTQMGQDVRRENGGRAAPGQALSVSPASSAPLSTPSANGASWPPPAQGATPEHRERWDHEFLRDNLIRILERARAHDIFVRFDMESTSHTQRTLDFFRELWSLGYRNVGVVLQSYLRRTEHDVRIANDMGVRIRLCKGAYKEPAEYAFPERGEVDGSYVALMKLLLDRGRYPGIATHDEAMLAATRAHVQERALPHTAFEFQMLYGIRRDLQQQLLADGYHMRVYVPFGEAWYPYLMRRMAERPANLLFVVGSVVREAIRGRRR